MTNEQAEYGLAKLDGIEAALERIADKIVPQKDGIERLSHRLEVERSISETQQDEIERLKDALEIEKCISADLIAKLDGDIEQLNVIIDGYERRSHEPEIIRSGREEYCPDCQCDRCWRADDE